MTIERCSIADVLAVTAHDPFVRSQARYRFGSSWWDNGTARPTVAFTSLDTDGQVRHLAALGSPERAAAVVATVLSEIPQVPRLSVPRGAMRYLPEWISIPRPTHWDFRSTTSAPPEHAAERRVHWLERSDEADIKGLLHSANPTASTWPGEAKVRRWAGIRDGDTEPAGHEGQPGRLLACLADTGTGNVGHFSAITTHNDARGQGLGTTVTAWATRRLLRTGCDIVTLGVYTDNASAQRVYDRLGFAYDHHFTSGFLAPCDR